MCHELLPNVGENLQVDIPFNLFNLSIIIALHIL